MHWNYYDHACAMRGAETLTLSRSRNARFKVKP
jgi:hypothetical protein